MRNWIDQYYKERFGYDTLTTESGFCVYGESQGQLYLAEFHIDHDFRQSAKHFLSFMEKLTEIAIEKNCTKFSCHVDLTAKNANEVLLSRLKFGFKIKEISGSKLGLVKEIF